MRMRAKRFIWSSKAGSTRSRGDAAEFGEGDSFSWNACTPHLVRNIGEDAAIVLISVYRETEQAESYYDRA